MSIDKTIPNTKIRHQRQMRGWSQKKLADKLDTSKELVSRWERGTQRTSPYYREKLCTIFGMTAEELGFLGEAEEVGQREIIEAPSITQDMFLKTNYKQIHPNARKKSSNVPAIDGSFEEVLSQCATGITTCDTLSDNGGHNEIVLATQIVETYIPTLQAILNSSSKHHLQAAMLLSKIFQIKQGTAYHLEGFVQSLIYAEEAVRYARISENVTELVTALHELATIYEWPLPALSIYACRKKALTLIEEAAYHQEKQRDIVPQQVQAWIYIGQAKLRALNGLKQEAYTSIGEAQKAFARKTNDLPGLYFNQVNLIRQESITYSYLNEQEKAIETFLKLIDVNDPQFAPKLPMHARTHLSLLSEVVISSLKRPSAKKDKDLTIQLWKAEMQKAMAMQSMTYIQEAQTTYQIMECVWPDDSEVRDLYDLLDSLKN